MSPRPETGTLLVLGLGNVLCGDDGLGIAAVASLAARYDVPESVRLVDGGTLGLSLLHCFDAADDALLVDAVRIDAPPGTLVRLDGDDVEPAVRERLSVHQVGVVDLLDGLRLLGSYPRRLLLYGLVPATLELDLARSPAVAAALPGLVDAVAAEIRGLGHPLAARGDGETVGDVLGDRHAARALGL